MRNQGLQSTDIQDLAQFPVAVLDRILGKFGFRPVKPRDIEEFHALADRLIEGEIASADVLSRVQDWTGRSLHLRRSSGEADALLASIPLTRAGRDALLAGRFGFADARRDWVCALDERAHALLSWGMAGSTPSAQAASVRGLLAGWHAFYFDTPVYARGRSAAGRRLLPRLGFRPVKPQPGRVPLYESTGFPTHLDRMIQAESQLSSRENAA